ncbi:MAG: sodium:calcium antiporter [Patescibacteria group bacterium]
MSYELFFYIFLLVIGVIVLIKSGFYVVRSLIDIAHFLNVSEFSTAFILMAVATSLPEFGIGINAALNKAPLISLGNILGGNILVLSFVLGLIILIDGNFKIKKHSPAHSSWFNFFLAISPIVFLFDGELSRFDGLILISLFGINLARLFKFRAIFHHHRFLPSFISHFKNRPDGLKLNYFFKNLLIFIVSTGILLLSAYLIVKSVNTVSLKLGFPQMLIGIFAVALSTTLPELSFGIKAALSRHEEMSLGNLLGTTVFNSTWILGIVSLISPIKITEPISFWISAVTMVLVVFLANLFLKARDSLNRWEGALLILIYLVFVAVQIIWR